VFFCASVRVRMHVGMYMHLSTFMYKCFLVHIYGCDHTHTRPYHENDADSSYGCRRNISTAFALCGSVRSHAHRDHTIPYIRRALSTYN